MIKKEQEEFIAFLKEHRAYKKFERNLKALREGMSAKEHIESTWIEKGSVLPAAFAWSRTKEGYDYWLNLSVKWSDL